MFGNNNTEENDFTKILTSTPPTSSAGYKSGYKRQTSWFKKQSGDDLVTCPSCKGSGIKETTNELVALIPYSDERLQPRRTPLKVAVAISITAIILGIIFFVFFPRHAEIKSLNMRVVSARIHYWDEPNSELTLEDTTVLNNKNYFPITMTALNTSVAISWSSSGVYNEVGINQTEEVPIAAHVKQLERNITIKTGSYPPDRLFRTCCYVFAGHYIWFRVTLNARFKLSLFGSYDFSSTDVQTIPVECDYNKNSEIKCDYNI